MRIKAEKYSEVISMKPLVCAAIMFLFCALGLRAQDDAEHAVVGTVQKVDAAGKTIAIKTADGTVKTVKYTDETTVHGFKDAGKAADLTGKVGAHVVVYTGKETAKGADKTASAIVYAGKGTGHAIKGTVVKVDDSTKTVVVKTANGTEESFRVSDHAVIDTGEGVGKFSKKTAKEGDQVTVHYTEDAGNKIAHAFSHL